LIEESVMQHLKDRVRVARVCAVALLALTAGCGHWPFRRTPPPAPPAVHELDISGDSGTYPQYWKRNALLVDLSAASGSGSITLRPVAGSTWPVRLALRVTPGAIGALDVRGAQRVNLPISPTPAKPVDLELPPGVYPPKTAAVSVSWGPAATP
jgi:hypothetical protein